MVTVPAATPVTMPEVDPTVAIDGLLVSHVPPETASPSVKVPPTPTVVPPDIGASGLTVNVIVAILVPNMYVMVHVPAEIALTIPVDEPTVAIAVLLLLQWPPAVESARVLVAPTHALAVPMMLWTEVVPVTVTMI